MKNEKELKELFKNSEEAFIVATKNGIGLVGSSAEILALLTGVIREVKNCKGVEEKDIERAIELSKLDEKQLLERALNSLKDLIKNI